MAADTRPLEVCECVWDRDAGALWADITQDAHGGGIGVMGQRRLSVELANTPVIPCKHANTHTLCFPRSSRCGALIHTLINRLILAAAALYTSLNATHGNQ